MRFSVTDKYNFWFGLKPQAKATIKKNQQSKADQSWNWIKDMQLCIHYCWENVQQYQEKNVQNHNTRQNHVYE